MNTSHSCPCCSAPSTLLEPNHCPCFTRLGLAYAALRQNNLDLRERTDALEDRSEQLLQANNILRQRFNSQADEVSQIRQSHSALLSQMSSLFRSVELHSEVAVSLTSRTRFSAHVAKNVLRNVSRNFMLLISSRPPALTRPPVQPTEFTTIATEQNTSDVTDCSLLELQAVLAALRARGSVISRCYPSAYDVDFADTRTVRKLSIHFRDYFSMCDALLVPVPQRIKGIYRDRRTRDHNVRTIQLTGAAVFSPPSSTSKVLLGASDLTHSSSATVLLHDEPMWHGVDWDCGFTHDNLSVSSSAFDHLRNELQTTEEESQGFMLSWERKRPQPTVGLSENTADEVLGYLKTSIPVVIVRGAKLIASARRILGTPEFPSQTITRLCNTPSR